MRITICNWNSCILRELFMWLILLVMVKKKWWLSVKWICDEWENPCLNWVFIGFPLSQLTQTQGTGIYLGQFLVGQRMVLILLGHSVSVILLLSMRWDAKDRMIDSDWMTSPVIHSMACSYMRRVGIKNTHDGEIIIPVWRRENKLSNLIEFDYKQNSKAFALSFFLPLTFQYLIIPRCIAPMSIRIKLHIHPSIHQLDLRLLPQPQLCHFQAIPFAPFPTFVSYFVPRTENIYPTHCTWAPLSCPILSVLCVPLRFRCCPETLNCTFDCNLHH